MNWINSLLFESGIAHDILVLAVVITGGTLLSKIKLHGISLGATWILFVGILAAHFGFGVTPETLKFIKEFGLILFVFSIGLQVGPSFFSSFKHGGMRLVGYATLIVAIGVLTTYIIHVVTGTPIPTMVGVMSGAVTNTPGLGAAQQAFSDSAGYNDSNIAMGYAVAYPLGMVGVIISLIVLRFALRIKSEREDKALEALSGANKQATKISIEVTNSAVEGQTIAHIGQLINRKFVISRIVHPDDTIIVADAESRIKSGDRLLVICEEEDSEAIITFLGHSIEVPKDDWGSLDSQLVSRRISITRPEINGKKFSDLRLRLKYGINITRVNRAGVDLVPYQGMELQIGDKLMVVGSEKAVEEVAKILGNSLKQLHEPHIVTIFLGIALGVLLGSIPLLNIPQPIKLGLAGGPLIVAILIGKYGTRFGLITYTTMSANLMLREIGLALFLAAVGIGAGDGFVAAIVGGGYRWIGYGVIITMLPTIIVGIVARFASKMNFYTLMGLIAGSQTNPIALSFSNNTAGNNMPSLSYSTVYPFVTFLRVAVAQIFILFAL